MDTIDKIDVLCKENSTSISQLEKDLGFSNGSLKKSKSIKADKLLLISYKFNVPMELLVETHIKDTEEFKRRIMSYQAKIEDNKTSWQPTITEKDEKDIKKKLDDLINQLSTDTGLMYDGEPMDDESLDAVRAALEVAERTAMLEARRKFTPDKYKK